MIDVAIDRERYDNQNIVNIRPKDESYWAQILVQGEAALIKAPFEHVLTRLTRLKIQKPTQYMDEHSVAVFLEDICEHLEKREYCYYAIDRGISNLLECEEDKFFPTMKVLLKYIHPIHWKLKLRISKIQKLLKQNRKKNILPIEKKEDITISEREKNATKP